MQEGSHPPLDLFYRLASEALRGFVIATLPASLAEC